MKTNLQHYALKMRRNSSLVEKIMWRLLRDRKLNRFKFRRQHIIEPYIVDFVCIRKKLIIEMDGDHHVFQQYYDASRTRYLESLGYKVLRFKNSDVLNDRVPEMLKAILGVLCA